MRRLLILALMAMAALPAAAQTSFYTDRALQQVNVLTSPTPLTAAIPYGPVRVCSLPLTQQSPCLPLATITDVNGNPISNSIGPLFGQLTTDATGRFTFGCTNNVTYQVQVTQAASNTPAVNYPVTCPGGVGASVSANNAFTGNNTIASLNNCIQVEGTKYAKTDVGIQQAINAAGSGLNGQPGCVKLSAGVYTFSASNSGSTCNTGVGCVQQLNFDSTIDMTGAVINMESPGAAIVMGQDAARTNRANLIGGWIRKTTGGVITPDITVGNVGVEWRNVNAGRWDGGARITGFEKGIYLHAKGATGGVSEVAVHIEQIYDCKYGLYLQPDALGTAFVSGNTFYGDGIITYITTSVNWTGGHNIFIDSNGQTFGAASNVFNALTLESQITVGGGNNPPEDFAWVNGVQNQFTDVYTEGPAGGVKNTWFIDNSGAQSQRNQFKGNRGGGSVIGLSNFRINNTTNPGDSRSFQYVQSERSVYISGGNGCNTAFQVGCIGTTDPILVVQEVNANANKEFSVRDTGGVERYLIDGGGNVTQSGNIVLNSGGAKLAIAEGTAPANFGGIDACYGDSTLHALKCSYNNGTFFQIAQVITATSAAFATATTAGTCVQNTTAVTGATTAMAVSISPVSTPGVGAVWSAFVSSAGNVTINECAVATSAGGTIVFNIRVTP